MFLICVYSMMIVHTMTHIHTHNSDFDTVATGYSCVEQQIETQSSCGCKCGHTHQNTTRKIADIDIRIACQSTTCMGNHNDDHQHHECNIVTIYDNASRDSNQKQFTVDTPSCDIPYVLSSDDYSDQLIELTINTSYLLRQIPLPKSAYVLSAKTLRAPPVVIFS